MISKKSNPFGIRILVYVEELLWLFSFFKENSIGVNVHYIPVHLHPFYKRNYNTKEGDFPIAESLYEEIISLPIYPQMSDDDVQRVVTLLDIISKNEK